jgi:hypothetical protein
MLDLWFLRAATLLYKLPTPMSVSGANANANEVVLMPMVQLSNRLLKIVASVIGVSVVTTLYETSDEERVCSI